MFLHDSYVMAITFNNDDVFKKIKLLLICVFTSFLCPVFSNDNGLEEMVVIKMNNFEIKLNFMNIRKTTIIT